LEFHLSFAADYLAVAALGAEHAAAALLTGVSFAELVGHLAVLRGGFWGCFCLDRLLEFHGGLATGDGAVAALGHYELGTALAAYVAFAGLISQLLSSNVFDIGG